MEFEVIEIVQSANLTVGESANCDGNSGDCTTGGSDDACGD